MSEPFLAEVRMVGFTFAPRGWALCDGQILPIAQNQSLYSLLGTTYGGDGRTTFALPDLRGRVPIHFDDTYRLGSHGGEERHTLTEAELPSHSHGTRGSTMADSDDPAGAVGGQTEDETYHGAANPTLVDMSPGTVAAGGGNQGHENMQPFLALNYCIALQGVFPSRN